MSAEGLKCDCGGDLRHEVWDDQGHVFLCKKCQRMMTRRCDFLGLCGCGLESIEGWLVSILRAIECRSQENLKAGSTVEEFRANSRAIDKIIAEAPEGVAEEFVLHMLDHLGLTEHGTNISGSWLTDRGSALIESYVAFPIKESPEEVVDAGQEKK